MVYKALNNHGPEYTSWFCALHPKKQNSKICRNCWLLKNWSEKITVHCSLLIKVNICHSSQANIPALHALCFESLKILLSGKCDLNHWCPDGKTQLSPSLRAAPAWQQKYLHLMKKEAECVALSPFVSKQITFLSGSGLGGQDWLNHKECTTFSFLSHDSQQVENLWLHILGI